MKVLNKLFYSKQDIDAMVEKLAASIIKSNKKIDLIVGIENGGLHVSIPLAKLLNKPHASIVVSFYRDSKTPHKTPIVNDKGISWNSQDSYLFVDDLIDSGNTIKILPKIVKKGEISTAVLFWKKDNEHNVKPTYYVAEKPNGWIEFYWE